MHTHSPVLRATRVVAPLPALPALPGGTAPRRRGRLVGSVAALLLAASTAATPQVLPPQPGAGLPPEVLPPQDMARALQLLQQAAAATAPAGARVLVEALPADPRLKLAPCARADAFLPPGQPAWGRTRVGLRCVQGSVAWTLYQPALVQVLAPALTVRHALPMGHVLAEQDLLAVDTDWAARAERPLASPAELLGRTLARPVQPGQPLRSGDLRRRQWFASGEVVKVLASGPGFSVSGEGVALADGIDGQRVRVQLQPRDGGSGNARQVVVQAVPVGERLVQVPLW